MTSYDKTLPQGNTPFPQVDDQHRDNNAALEERLAQEHQFPSNPFTTHTSGRHKFGVGSIAARDALLTNPQPGMVWVDTDTIPPTWQVYAGGAWISNADTVDGNQGVYLSKGLFLGGIDYASVSTITIRRGNVGALMYEVGGAILYHVANDVTLDLSNAGDREDVSEAPSTFYYIYATPTVGVFKFSSTAPILVTSGAYGYHPGGLGRCLGAVWNNASGNIQPFDYNPRTGLWQFRSIVSAFTKSPGTSLVTSYTSLDLAGTLPATARTVRIRAYADTDDYHYFYGHESLSGVASSTPSIHRLTASQGAADRIRQVGVFDIAVDSTPTIKWAMQEIGSGGGINEHTVEVIGWYDDLGFFQ